MYRHALIVACSGCTAPVPVKWAELDPTGFGHRCFRCVVASQIATHQAESNRGYDKARLTTRVGIAAVVLMLILVLIGGAIG